MKKIKSKSDVFKLFLISIQRSFGLVWNARPLTTIVVFASTLFTSVFPGIILWITKFIIDNLTLLLAQHSYDAKTLNNLWWLVVSVAFVWLVARLTDTIHDVSSSIMEFKVGAHVQLLIMKKCSQLDLAFFENSNNLDMLENARSGALMSSWILLQLLFSLVGAVIMMITFLLIIARLHWVAMLIMLISVLPELLIALNFVEIRWKLTTNRANDRRFCSYVMSLVTQPGYVKEMRVFDLSSYLIEQWKICWVKIFSGDKRLIYLRNISGFLSGFFEIIGAIFVWSYAIYRSLARTITLGDVVLYTKAAENCQGAMVGLFNIVANLYKQTLFLGNLFALIDIDSHHIDGSLKGIAGYNHKNDQHLPISSLKSGIEFRNVSFRYPGQTEWVLRNISFRIPINESVALVGQNGAGKTTIIKLLLRLYDPTDGVVLLDDRDLREYDVSSLRKIYGLIFQDYARYFLTFRENIGFGDIESIENIQLIKNACIKAGADKILQRFPSQYETYLGKLFIGGGGDLSGGEWQKVALARAFMRESQILILDEPTASLDAFSEYEFLHKLAATVSDKMLFLISHRFSTVRMAHQIIVIEQGRLIEAGCHDELMVKRGLYCSMFKRQADYYC